MSRQRAGFANQENAQRIADTNAANRQGTQTTNLERQNRLRTQGYDDAMQKAMAQAQILGQASQLSERDKARRYGALQGGLMGLGGIFDKAATGLMTGLGL
jgi:hypothetical protein